MDGDPLGTRGTAWSPETRLYSDGVVIAADGSPLIVPPHSGLRRLTGTGYLDPESGALPGAAVPAADELAMAREILAGTDLPGRGTPYEAMAEEALLDIGVLTFPNGAAVAAGSPYWRYVWPRDAGYMAAALTVSGRPELAYAQLAYVAAMQEHDGTWQARYLPDGSREVPDDRGLQLDGIGWTLWGTWVFAGATGSDPAPLAAMIRRSVSAALAALDPGAGLPKASQDFWEMDLDEATLGSAAPLLLGLRTGRDLLSLIGGQGGDAELAARAADGADRLADAVSGGFGAHGYARRISGSGGRDASVAFLLPPFAPADGADGARAAWCAAVDATTVGNGGVRPGEEWTDLVTAWTPQVSLHALTAASGGDTALAHRLLSWLDLRRTALGALPEKVTDAGRPAAVAPLGLTGATVLLALAALDGRPLPVPAG
jgi:GH15 family glucan-1,4-alpha-glucosidase